MMSKHQTAKIGGYIGSAGFGLLAIISKAATGPNGWVTVGVWMAFGTFLGYILTRMVLAFFPPDFWTAIRKNKLDRIKKLISKGVDVDAIDWQKFTPLMYAAQYGYKDLAELLLKSDADVNMQGSDGTTALMIASYGGRKDIVQLLLDYEADINIKSNKGITAIDVAKSNKEANNVVQLLLNHEVVKNEEISDNQNLLPREIECPNCCAALTMSKTERIKKEFACPFCVETIRVSD